MRSAIVSGVILICLTLIIIASSFYCVGVTEELSALLSSDRVMTEEGASELCELWRRNKMILHLGVNMEYTDSVSEGIALLRAAIKTESEADIAASLELLNIRIEQLKRLNMLDLENIL